MFRDYNKIYTAEEGIELAKYQLVGYVVSLGATQAKLISLNQRNKHEWPLGYSFSEHHRCRVDQYRTYSMGAHWIDTDNQCWWGWIFAVMCSWCWLFHMIEINNMKDDLCPDREIRRRRFQCYADIFGAVLITVLHILIL